MIQSSIQIIAAVNLCRTHPYPSSLIHCFHIKVCPQSLLVTVCYFAIQRKETFSEYLSYFLFLEFFNCGKAYLT